MAGFLTGASDAFDALAQNILPFYEFKTSADVAKDNARTEAAAKTAAANATAISATANAKLYASMAIAAVSAVAILLIIKKRRG